MYEENQGKEERVEGDGRGMLRKDSQKLVSRSRLYKVCSWFYSLAHPTILS